MMHRILKRIVPFLYERNWYNGQLELSRTRAVLFLALLFAVTIAVVYFYVESRPIHYVS